MPHLEFTKVLLIHFNIANNNYQQNSRVLHTFVLNKSFGQLLDISPKDFIFSKYLTQNFHIISSKPREIEGKIIINLGIH